MSAWFPWSRLKRLNSELFRTIGVTSLAATPIAAGVVGIVNHWASANHIALEIQLPVGMYVLYVASLCLISGQMILILFAPHQTLHFNSALEHSTHWISSYDATSKNRQAIAALLATRLKGALQARDLGIDAAKIEQILTRAAPEIEDALKNRFRQIEDGIAKELDQGWEKLDRSRRWARWPATVCFGTALAGYLALIFYFGPTTLLR